LGSFSVGSCFDVLLSVSFLGEGESEDSDDVSVVGLAVDSRLDETLPLADHRAESVSGDVQSVEGSLSVLAVNIIDDQLHLSPRKKEKT